MPVPILKIPIDDAAFQRYLATFNKYQKQLEDQPEVWGGINESIGALALAGAAVAAEIAHQSEQTRKLVAEEKKREEALKKAAKEKADSDKDEANRDKEAAQRRKHAIDQVKEYSRSLAEAAVNLGKWAIIGEGASLAAGALTFWGLDRFVAGVGEQRRAAQGLNVSMGQQQGSNLYLQRYFDVNSALSNVATAQETPASWGLFRMMGIDPQGKDPSQLTNEAAIAARRMFIRDRENLGLAQAQGLTQIFSAEDLRRLAATPEGELRSSIAQSNKFAANSGLSDEVGRKWQNFLINLDTAGLKLKNSLIDKLTTLEPDLEVLIVKFTQLATTVLDRIDFKVLGDGLDAFTKYIGSKQFQDDFKTVVDDISLLAKKLVDALVFLNLIPDPSKPSGPTGGTPTQGFGGPGNPVDVGTKLGPLGTIAALGPVFGPAAAIAAYGADVVNGYFAKGPAGSLPATNKYTTAGMDQRNAEGVKFFMGKGWTFQQAAGIIGSDDAEGYNSPNPVGWNDGGTAFGTGQWHKDRQARFLKLFGHDIQHSTLGEQWEFQNWELNNSEKATGDRLRRDTDAYTAGADYVQYAGRGRNTAGDRISHGRAAQHVVKVVLQNQTGASVATTVNSAAGG